jgi:hypothetical protein
MINCAYLLFVLLLACVDSSDLAPESSLKTADGSYAAAQEHIKFFCEPAPPAGRVYARFDKLVNDYFFQNFGAAGTAYLRSLGDCPGDEMNGISSVELKNAIIAEMSHVVESYGAWEDVSFFEKGKRMFRRDQRDSHKRRFRVHRVVALILHFSKNPTPNVISVEKIKYENAVRESKQRRLQDACVSWIQIYKLHENKVVKKRLEIREKLIVDALKLIGNTFTLNSYEQTLNALILAGQTVVTHFHVCGKEAPRGELHGFLYESVCEHIPSLLKDCTTVDIINDRLLRLRFFFLSSPKRLNQLSSFDKLIEIWRNGQQLIRTVETRCEDPSTETGLIREGIQAILVQIIGFVFNPFCKFYRVHASLTGKQGTWCPTKNELVLETDAKLQRLNKLICYWNPEKEFVCDDYVSPSKWFRTSLAEARDLGCQAIPLTHD